jgi:hypothetical protein
MLHGSLSVASGLRYEADGLRCVLQRAAWLLRAANSRGAQGTKVAGQDVCLADVLGDTIAAMALSVDEARALLLVLGACRETIYERVLWQMAVDEAMDLPHRH